MNDSPLGSAWLETPTHEVIPVEGTLSLGRSEKNAVLLRDPSVSRKHALLHCQPDGEVWRVDLGSINGTLLNGHRIFQPVKLRHADRIEIAESTFVFHHKSESDKIEESTSGSTVPELTTEPLWLLLADIEGFTPLSQATPPAHLSMLVGSWFLQCQKIVEKHGGSICKYTGDGFLANWRDDDDGTSTAQVAQTCLALASSSREGKPRFRFVIHRGLVSKGRSPAPGDEGIMGATVNFVFRMETLASRIRESILISEEANTKLSRHLRSALCGTHSLKGFDGDFRFFLPSV